jgi:polysaccharide pyruvyl transferase WcaK-like protein
MTAFRAGRWKPRRIGIVGFYGSGNLGDETVVAILIKKIREHYPNAEIFGFSLNPRDTEQRHGIKAFPISWKNEVRVLAGQPLPSRGSFGKLKAALKNWPVSFRALKTLMAVSRMIPRDLPFLRRCLHRLQGLDLLVVPGSGPLTDWWGGPSWHPYTFLTWALLARLTRTKVIALSIGSERLTTRLGKMFCNWFLSLAHYRSFRDQYSRDTMKALGLKNDDPVFPDQGFALTDLLGPSAMASSRGQYAHRDSGLVIGVSPVGHMTCVSEYREDGNESVYRRYIETLSAFVLWLVQRGHRIAFCPTDFLQDPPFVEQIIGNIRAALPGVDVTSRIIQEPIVTTKQLIACINMCDIMIASRFHAVVIPFALRKPVLALSYGRKVRDLMAECGQAAYHWELDEADVEDMKRAFQALEQDRHAIGQHLGVVGSEYRSRLDTQYREVFGRSKQASMVSGAPTEVWWSHAGEPPKESRKGRRTGEHTVPLSVPTALVRRRSSDRGEIMAWMQ